MNLLRKKIKLTEVVSKIVGLVSSPGGVVSGRDVIYGVEGPAGGATDGVIGVCGCRGI